MNQIRTYLATIVAVLVLGVLDGCTPKPPVPNLAPGLRVYLPTFSRQVWRDTSYTKIIGTDSFHVSRLSGILTIDAPDSFAVSTSGTEWFIYTGFVECPPVDTPEEVVNDYVPPGATEDDWDGDGIPNHGDSGPGSGDTDRDGDGILNPDDNCPGVYNPSGVDVNDPSSDRDGDCDGIPDPIDPSPEGRIRGSLIGGLTFIIVDERMGPETLMITLKRH